MLSKILVVDDHKEIRELVSILLSGEGYAVYEAQNGEETIEMVKRDMYDVIILDVMMPFMDGYQTCTRIREFSNAPILFLSAKSQEDDKILGIDCGGDDYLVKPFSYVELLSKVKALIRRYHEYNRERVEQNSIQFVHGIKIDKTTEKVYRDQKDLNLTTLEFDILASFIKRRGEIIAVKALYETVWGDNYYFGANNTIMVHIANLRKKIEVDPQNPKIIRTIWGKGYRCD